MSNTNIEETNELMLDFSKIAKIADNCKDVIPAAVQDADSKEIILIAYVNEKALKNTIETGIATFWSTSRNKLWIKGEESGNTYSIIDIFVNCEQNSLVYTVRANVGGICHTNNKNGEPRNCYYRKIDFKTHKLDNINP